MNNTIPLINLFGKHFSIPSYQRGYRWGFQEVTELLDDLWDFQQNSENGEFYCLQPIVLKKINENKYDVIDGQQRLTTLFLILTFLEDRRLDEGYVEELFTITYETRKDCDRFLAEKLFIGNVISTNIDYHYICYAYQHIESWFAGKKGAKGKLTMILMDKDSPKSKNVKLIWYEIGENEKPVDAFVRLNIGKIPLTDAELIKALLLQSDKYESGNKGVIDKKLFEIASEWDQIEYQLQKEDFWYFLNNKENEKATHIEFIFNLIAEKKQKKHKLFENIPAKHSTYLIINAYLDRLRKPTEDHIIDDAHRISTVEKFWKEVVEYFDFFSEWFEKRKLFHYIGFLIIINGQSEIDYLIAQSKKLKKTIFVSFLEDRIALTIDSKKLVENGAGEKILLALEDLRYEVEEGRDDKKLIHNILLLHNIVATLNSDKEMARFPFNIYKKTKTKEKWSLEHIHAQNSEIITNIDHQRIWLKDHLKSFENFEDLEYTFIIGEIKALLSKLQFDQSEFEEIFEKVYKIINKQSNISDDAIHKIGNLCLIDAATNSQLNNSVFDVKREKIKGRELKGHYIPVCSKSVFLKAYTEYPQNNAFWTELDREAYTENIRHTLARFIPSHWKN